MRRAVLLGLLLALLALLGLTGAASPATAAPAAKDPCTRSGATLNPTPYDPATLVVKIAQAKLSHQASPNHITMEIAIKNRNGAPVCEPYAVSLQFGPVGEPLDEASGCAEVWFNDPDTPRGRYHCTAIVEDPGKWSFETLVYSAAGSAAPRQSEVVRRVSTILEIGDAVPLLPRFPKPTYVVEASPLQLVLTQAHVVASGLWIVLALTVAFMTVPRLRRMMSSFALCGLERRWFFLSVLLRMSLAVSAGTGLYMLAAYTPYDEPLSTEHFFGEVWADTMEEPHAEAYYFLLYAKVLVFVLMAVATTVLARDALRTIRPGAVEDDEFRGPWSEAVAVLARPRYLVRPRVGARTLTACAVFVLVGALVIGAAVVGLNHLHELIEADAAREVLLGGW